MCSGVELIGIASRQFRQLWACKGEGSWPLGFWPGVAASTGWGRLGAVYWSEENVGSRIWLWPYSV